MTFWPRGHTRYGTSKQTRKITLLAAISVWGLEYFTLIKGGVNMLIFTQFMNELEKILIPKMEKRLKRLNFKHKDVVYLFDNACKRYDYRIINLFLASHVGGWSGWWLRGAIKGTKITIPPYSPEYK